MINICSFIDLQVDLKGTCELCGGPTPGEPLCNGCQRDLQRAPGVCARCALDSADGNAAVCAACSANPPPQARTLAGCDYAWPADRLVSRFKDGGQLAAGRALLPPLLAAIERQAERPALITEVPSSWHGIRKRGFQQARLIARWIGQATGIPHEPGVLRRARSNRPQRGLSRRARQSNLAANLHVRRPLEGQHVALVDDVITTGSTTAEASRVLLAAGAGRVTVWGLARAPRAHRQRSQ